MFKRILVAYDGSDGARAALDVGIDLAKRLRVDLHSVSVVGHLPRYAATIDEVQARKEESDAYFRTLTKEARDRAGLQGVLLESTIRRGDEADLILSVAREGKFDLLLMGHRGHSPVLRRIIGSAAVNVARLTPCSVMFVRPGPAPERRVDGIRRILVGIDGSPLGRLALHTALDLAALWKAEVTGVTVCEVSPATRPEEVDRGFVDPLRAAAEEHARAAGVSFEHATRVGHAAQGLCDEARDRRADLVVLGATGLEHPWSVAIGGTATRVVSEAHCSVLLVRSPQSVLHVRDIMVRAVSSVPADAPIGDVVELLLRRNVKALPVVDARRHVVGIITGGDLLNRADLDLRLSINRETDADTVRERLRALAQSQKTAGDVMTRHIHTVDADVDLATAIGLMASRRVKRLPVVAQDGELVGIVSRADVLRAIAAQPESVAHEERAPMTGRRAVGDAATVEAPTVLPEAPAETVLAKILEGPLRRVVVTDADGRVLGLIGDRDLLARSSPDTRSWFVRMLGTRPPAPRVPTAAKPVTGPGGRLTAADLMAPELITVRPEDSLVHAIRLMMQHQVKRLIVVDAEGRFRGLVDRREILRLLAATG